MVLLYFEVYEVSAQASAGNDIAGKQISPKK